jgi:serine/threonine-protein phosphatase 5
MLTARRQRRSKRRQTLCSNTQKYTDAVSYNPTVPSYFTNRSFANLKLELYGAAAIDATSAIELDQNFSKGYYRRAIANMALGELKEASKDLRMVCKLEPGNPDARKKLTEWYVHLNKRKGTQSAGVCQSHFVR